MGIVRTGWMFFGAALVVAASCAAGPRLALDAESPATISGIGAGQGAAVVGGALLLYGDAETGVVRTCDLEMARRGLVEPIGPTVRLTREGVDLLPHPTGLTSRDGRLAFIGNTVGGEGEIFAIDWETARLDGNLDRAVINRVEDDLAVNGSRPEFVRYQGRWVIATSDYGPENNEVRLYDPERLLTAERTSEEGVLIARYRCGPWVQNLHWVDAFGALALVQNQIEGLRYRLTFVTLEGERDLREATPIDLASPEDELEGFVLLGGGRCAMVSSSRTENVWFGRMELATTDGARGAGGVE